MDCGAQRDQGEREGVAASDGCCRPACDCISGLDILRRQHVGEPCPRVVTICMAREHHSMCSLQLHIYKVRGQCQAVVKTLLENQRCRPAAAFGPGGGNLPCGCRRRAILAERLGSYSSLSTMPDADSPSRLKSMMR